MMGEVLSFPAWLTAIILLFLSVLFIVRRIVDSKRRLTLWDFMTPVLQALFALSVIITGVNLILLWVAGELPFPRTPIEPVHPLSATGFLLLGLGLWVIYKNLGRRKR